MLDAPETLIAASQIGIAFTSILLGAAAGTLAAPLVAGAFPSLPHPEAFSLSVSILLITYISLLFGEFLPKKIALQDPETVLLGNVRALSVMETLARPFVGFLSSSANAVMLLIGVNPQIDDAVTEDEVKDLIEQGTEDGTFEKTEQYMVDRIFHLSDQTVYSLMTPRTQMFWLDLSDSQKRNLKLIRDRSETVFAVGKDSLDDFCGILYAKELLNASLERKSMDLTQYLHRPMFVPRSMEVFRLLEKFRDTGTHEAVVLDEYGGVVGFVTLNDIMGKIIGDSSKAGGEQEPAQFIQRSESSWIVDGLYPVDDFKRRFDLDSLPEEDHDHFQTMGGFLSSYFGYLPKVGETCEWNGFRFVIIEMDRARIDKIMVTKMKAEAS
ncbi:MAG: HlyC/CorC family transporter [Selenomonadaceae bacterium]|nr:HlyC/CorC family transporter [Selenomonadaceae bacterium]